MKLDRVLVGVDFSEPSQKALTYALEIARVTGATVEVIHAVTPPTFLPMDAMLWGEQQKTYVERLTRELEEWVRSVAGEAAPSVVRRVETGIAYDLLVTASENVDLLVLGTHGRTGLPHLLLGSVAERTLRFARCPVLTVPPNPGAADEKPPVLYLDR